MSNRQHTATTQSIRVWDPLVRVLHWTLVISVAVAWLTSEEGQRLHQIVGYVALAGITLRLLWGWLGPRYARFSQFVHRPQVVIGYFQQVLAGTAPRYLGHNPLGGWMIVALLLNLALVGLTGFLLTTDTFWGSEMMEEVHESVATFMLILIAAHIGGVIFSSRHHHENLARAMVTGVKPAPRAGDIV